MKLRLLSQFLASTFVLLACIPQFAEATPYVFDPCKEFSKASAVFIGRLREHPTKHSSLNNQSEDSYYSIWFEVIEGFKKVRNGERVRVHLYTALEINQDYLVFRYDGRRADIVPTSEAGSVLQFLRSLRYDQPAQLSGVVDLQIGLDGYSLPLTNVTLKIKGTDTSVEVKTGAAGRFIAPGLSAGNYEVEVIPPGGYAGNDLKKTVLVCQNCCDEPVFYLRTSQPVIQTVSTVRKLSLLQTLKFAPASFYVALTAAAGIALTSLLYVLLLWIKVTE